MENSPLQIRTDSIDGSYEQVKVYFDTAGEDFAGGVFLYFRPPKYWLRHCSSSKTNFPTDLPTETDKIWTIKLTKTSGTVRVIINCNNKEVLNVVLSNSACSDSSWSTFWSRKMEKIWFYSSDTASHYYRPGKINKLSLLVVHFQFYFDTASDYYRPGKQVKFISFLLPILL